MHHKRRVPTPGRPRAGRAPPRRGLVERAHRAPGHAAGARAAPAVRDPARLAIPRAPPARLTAHAATARRSGHILHDRGLPGPGARLGQRQVGAVARHLCPPQLRREFFQPPRLLADRVDRRFATLARAASPGHRGASTADVLRVRARAPQYVRGRGYPRRRSAAARARAAPPPRRGGGPGRSRGGRRPAAS